MRIAKCNGFIPGIILLVLCLAPLSLGSADQSSDGKYCELVLDHFNVSTYKFGSLDSKYTVPANQSRFVAEDNYSFKGGFANVRVILDLDYPARVPVINSKEVYINWTARGMAALDSQGLGMGRGGHFRIGSVREFSPGGNGTENRLVTFNNSTSGSYHEKRFLCEWLPSGFVPDIGSISTEAGFNSGDPDKDELVSAEIKVEPKYKLVKQNA